MVKKDSLKPERVKWHLQQGFVVSPSYSLNQTFVESDEFIHKFNENPGKFTLFALKEDEHGHLDVADRFFVEVIPSDTRILFIEPIGHLDLQLGKPLKVRLEVLNPENLKTVLVSLDLKKERFNLIEFGESGLPPNMSVVNLNAEIPYEQLEAILGKELLNKGLKFDLFVRGFDHDDRLLVEGRQTVTFFLDITKPKDLMKEYKCKSGILRVNIIEPERGVMEKTGKNIWWAMDKCMNEKYTPTKEKRCCMLTKNLVMGASIHLADNNDFIPTGGEDGRSVIINLDENDKKENWLAFLAQQFDEYIKNILPIEEAKVVIEFEVPKADVYVHKSKEEIIFVLNIVAQLEIRSLISSLDVRINSEMDDEFQGSGFVLDLDNTQDRIEFNISSEIVNTFKPNYNYNVVCKIIDKDAKDISNVINKVVKRESKNEEIEVKIIKPKDVVEITRTKDVEVTFGYRNNTDRAGEITIYAAPLNDDGFVSKKDNIIIETRKVKPFSHKIEDNKVAIVDAKYQKYRVFVSLVLGGHLFSGKRETSDYFDVLVMDVIEPKKEVGLKLLKDINDLYRLEKDLNYKLIRGQELLAEDIEAHRLLVVRNELTEKEITNTPAGLFKIKYHCWNFSADNYELIVVRQKSNTKGKVVESFELIKKDVEKRSLLTEEFPVPTYMLEPSNYRFVVTLKENKVVGGKELSDSILLHLLPGELEEKTSTDLGEFGFLKNELAVLEFVEPVKNDGELLVEKPTELKFTLNFKDDNKRKDLDFMLFVQDQEKNIELFIKGFHNAEKKYVLPFKLKFNKKGKYSVAVSPEILNFIKSGREYLLTLALVDFYEGNIAKPFVNVGNIDDLWDQKTGELRGIDLKKIKVDWKIHKGQRMRTASNYANITLVKEAEPEKIVEEIVELPEQKGIMGNIKFISPEGGGKHHVFEELGPIRLDLDVYDPTNQIVQIICYIKSERDKGFSSWTPIGEFVSEDKNKSYFVISGDLLLRLNLNTEYIILAQSFKEMDGKPVHGSSDKLSISFGLRLTPDGSEISELEPYNKTEESVVVKRIEIIKPEANDAYLTPDYSPEFVVALYNLPTDKQYLIGWYLLPYHSSAEPKLFAVTDVVGNTSAMVIPQERITSLFSSAVTLDYILSAKLYYKEGGVHPSSAVPFMVSSLYVKYFENGRRIRTGQKPEPMSSVETSDIGEAVTQEPISGANIYLKENETADLGDLGSEPKTKILKEKSQLLFYLGDSGHTLKLDDFSLRKKKAKITLSSKPVTIELRSGEGKLVNLDEESVYVYVGNIDLKGVEISLTLGGVSLMQDFQERGKGGYKEGGLKRSHAIPNVKDDYKSGRAEVDLFKKKKFLENFFPELKKFLDEYKLTNYFGSMKSSFETEIFNTNLPLADCFVKAAIAPSFLLEFNNRMGPEYITWKNEILTNYKELINYILEKWLRSPAIIDRPFINVVPGQDLVEVVGETFIEGYDPGVVVQVLHLIQVNGATSNVEVKGKVIVAAGSEAGFEQTEPPKTEVQPTAFEAIAQYQDRKKRGKSATRSHKVPVLEKETRGLFGRKQPRKKAA